MKILSQATLDRIESPLMRRFELHEEIASTQERARELALSGAQHGTLVVSRVQTGGRGRHGRNWGSPAGGIWMSLVLRLPLKAEHTPRITQAAAVGVAKALHDIGVGARIKWPNDLLVEGGKICGILAAGMPYTISGASERGSGFVTLGIGLNANLDPRDLDVPDGEVATIRSVLGHDIDQTQLLETLLSHLDYEFGRIGHFENILSDWRKLNCTLGERVRIHKTDGAFGGVAIDITPQGALILDTGEKKIELFEGEVEHLRL
ncbi:N/A [soil metagenome]